MEGVIVHRHLFSIVTLLDREDIAYEFPNPLRMSGGLENARVEAGRHFWLTRYPVAFGLYYHRRDTVEVHVDISNGRLEEFRKFFSEFIVRIEPEYQFIDWAFPADSLETIKAFLAKLLNKLTN